MSKAAQEMRIASAEAEVERSRDQLLDTVAELADLFEPRKIVRDVWESAKVKGADLAEDAVDAVKRRPVAATGLVAALTMFLAREPIKDGIVKLYDAMTSDEDEDEEPKPAPRKRPAARPRKRAEKKT